MVIGLLTAAPLKVSLPPLLVYSTAAPSQAANYQAPDLHSRQSRRRRLGDLPAHAEFDVRSVTATDDQGPLLIEVRRRPPTTATGDAAAAGLKFQCAPPRGRPDRYHRKMRARSGGRRGCRRDVQEQSSPHQQQRPQTATRRPLDWADWTAAATPCRRSRAALHWSAAGNSAATADAATGVRLERAKVVEAATALLR